MDLTHALLGTLVVVELVVAIVAFVHLHRRSQIIQGVAAATYLAVRRLDEFVRRSA